MLADEQQFVLDLLRQSLGDGKRAHAPGGLDSRVVAGHVQRGGILLAVYSALGALPDAQQLLMQDFYASISQNVNQVHEGKRVLEALTAAGMQCMPVKGWDVRELYPNPAMRQMTDLDVLVRPYEYVAIEDAMVSLGFRPDEGESGRKHDVYFKGPVTVEVHKRLTDDSAAIRDWEARTWGRATVDESGVWHMSPEDVYIFHFVHMRRDFGNGWFGLRRIVDAWLLDRQRGKLDVAYIDGELEAMGIETFCERMCWLGRVCMGEERMDADAELLLRHAFDCGLLGNGTSYKAGRIASLTRGGASAGKVQSVLKAVFLPYGRMKAQFPVLERHPVLLPACWAKRIVHYLTNGKLAQYRSMLDYRGVTDEDVEHMRQVLRAGGC